MRAIVTTTAMPTMTRIALMQQEIILQLSKLLDETIKELAQYKSVEAEEERYKEIKGGIDGPKTR